MSSLTVLPGGCHKYQDVGMKRLAGCSAVDNQNIMHDTAERGGLGASQGKRSRCEELYHSNVCNASSQETKGGRFLQDDLFPFSGYLHAKHDSSLSDGELADGKKSKPTHGKQGCISNLSIDNKENLLDDSKLRQRQVNTGQGARVESSSDGPWHEQTLKQKLKC